VLRRLTAWRPADAEGLGQFATPLAIQRVPDGLHWVVHEKPAQVIQYIRAFLKLSV
jgi:pimeloyl-ACP methyl ester carboxylesterase